MTKWQRTQKIVNAILAYLDRRVPDEREASNILQKLVLPHVRSQYQVHAASPCIIITDLGDVVYVAPSPKQAQEIVDAFNTHVS